MNAKKTLALAASLALLSCKKELVPQDSSVVPATPNAVTQAPAPTSSPAPAVANPSPATPTAVAAGMNPPHGQPNHRCDIPVGAPLNSPPGKQAQTQAAPGKTMSMQPGTAAVKTAPGMNPPHGQPNHRCDIAVGAPLNSPVATKTSTPATSAPSMLIERNADGSMGREVPIEKETQPTPTN